MGLYHILHLEAQASTHYKVWSKMPEAKPHSPVYQESVSGNSIERITFISKHDRKLLQ